MLLFRMPCAQSPYGYIDAIINSFYQFATKVIVLS